MTKEEKDGYVYIKKNWSDEDIIELNFPMEVKLIEANDKVREDIGKIAVTRGPIVYCMEEADNGKDLHMLSVKGDTKAELSDINISGVLAKMVTLSGYRQEVDATDTGLYHTMKPKLKAETQLKYIPYYMWANRMENEMQVWTRLDS
jgi:DUF1680 family protein